jgi:CRP/FNR family transcriptional regulator, cyclic AMP receptor protein
MATCHAASVDSGKASRYGRGETIFSQGDVCQHVLYIRTGGVKLSVQSRTGREAIVGMLGPGEFFGEGCLAGQLVRTGSATALTPSMIQRMSKEEMGRLLHKRPVSDRFIAQMLARNIRLEEDLIDQIFSSSEKRLARALLLLAGYGRRRPSARAVPKMSLDTLAERVGASRSRIDFFLTKFKKLGFIEYDGDVAIKINSSLLSVVLQE